MAQESEWHNVARVAWLAGGAVAISNPGAEVQIGAGFRGRLLGSFAIPDFHSFIPALQALGLKVIGVTFVFDAKEALGLEQAEFRASTRRNVWLVEDVRQHWRQIAHASSRCDEMQLMDVAARIASGLAYSQMRLLDLAEAYSIQLRSRVDSGKRDEYCHFKDTHGISVYKAIHALFWELAVLRDVLAEFAAKCCFDTPKVTTWRGLIDSLKRGKSSDELAKELLSYAAEEKGGWIALFTAYRNFFTHSAPMDQALGSAFAVQDTQTISATITVPCIYYPLPPSISDLQKKRSESGVPFAKFQDFIDHNRQWRPTRESEPDALEYLSICLERMAELASVLAMRSPIEAKPIEISADELIGDLKVNDEKINHEVPTSD